VFVLAIGSSAERSLAIHCRHGFHEPENVRFQIRTRPPARGFARVLPGCEVTMTESVITVFCPRSRPLSVSDHKCRWHFVSGLQHRKL
jgi:hypothetical protein